MREMFDAIDADRNGFVDAEELKSTFASLGVPLSNNDVKQMLKEANIQGTRIFYEGTRTCDLEILDFGGMSDSSENFFIAYSCIVGRSSLRVMINPLPLFRLLPVSLSVCLSVCLPEAVLLDDAS
jgi:hypothetical protein